MPLFWPGDASDAHNEVHLHPLSGENCSVVPAESDFSDDITLVATHKLPVVHTVALDDPHLALMIDELCDQGPVDLQGDSDEGDDVVALDNRGLVQSRPISDYGEGSFHPTLDMITVAGGAFVIGLGLFLYYIVRYVTNVAMARRVGPITYGIYDEVIAVTVVLGWTAKLGLDNVLLRLIPDYRIHNQYSLIHGLFRFTLWITLAVGSVVGVVIFVFAPEISLHFYHNNEYCIPLRELAVLIPLQALQFLLAAGLQAFKAIRWKMLIDRLLQPLVTFVVLMMLYFYQWTMETLSFATIAGFVFTVALGWLALIVMKRRLTLRVPATFLPGYWCMITFPMFLNVLILGIIESTSMLLLGAFSSPLEVARYQNAERVASFVSVPTMALCIAFAPRVVEYYRHQRMDDLARLFKAVTRWSFTLSLPLFLGVSVFHQAILSTFGSYYTNVTPVMIMMAFGQLIFSLFGSAGYLLTMVARPRLILLNSITTSLIDFVLLLVLINYQGALGAGYAFALMMLIMYGLNFLQVYWLLDMQPWSRDMCKPLLAGIAAALIGVSLLPVIEQGPAFWLPWRQVAAMLIFALSYSLIVFVLRFSAEGDLVMRAFWRWFRRR